MSSEKLERIPFTCTWDCGGRCELIAYVQDGRIERIDTPPEREDTDENPRLIPCLRGRARKRLNDASEQLTSPLKRTGTSFREISWDEALDEVAGKLTEIKDKFGTEALIHITGYGSLGGRGFSGLSASDRFFSYWGNVTGTYGNPSSWCAGIASDWMLGGVYQVIHSASLIESQLIILWGMNPAENRHGVNLPYYISKARDNGAKVILIDPRHTDSGVLADQWIPIKPGTDVALAAAIAYVWISDGTIDENFLNSCTSGYEDYQKYITGESDGIPKSPAWASQITGIPEDVIIKLAKEYAESKPAIILAGLGPQRTLYGEQTERALITLGAMSGNIGIKGGGFAHGGIDSSSSIGVRGLPFGPHRPSRRTRVERWGAGILDGSLDPPVKMAYIVATNAINRSSNTLTNIKALEGLDFVVVQDQYFTPTARCAHIVLPVCTDLERGDLVSGSGALFYNRKMTDPQGQSMTDYWIFSKLAEKLGFGEEYTRGKTQEEWIEEFLNTRGLDRETLEKDGVIHSVQEPPVVLGNFRSDSSKYPLKTASGKIQIAYPEAEKHGLPSIPSYIDNTLQESERYPLQLLTPHSKLRANSTGYANKWLQRLEPQQVWINPKDALSRNINHGDPVEIFNQYGKMEIPARITERITPGVVCVPQGVWYNPDEKGIDKGGCANVLTGDNASPTGGMAAHSEWVQVRRGQS